MAQSKYRKAAKRGPYRVFLTKPIVGLGYTAGTLYREHEYLGAALNDLDRKGFVPVMTEVMTEQARGLPAVQRMLLVCKRR